MTSSFFSILVPLANLVYYFLVGVIWKLLEQLGQNVFCLKIIISIQRRQKTICPRYLSKSY